MPVVAVVVEKTQAAQAVRVALVVAAMVQVQVLQQQGLQTQAAVVAVG
jgi:hypothetical protein